MLDVTGRRLASAGDDALEDSYWYRLAEGGETCYLCGRTLKSDEMYDRLFVVACMDCHDAQQERIKDKLEEAKNEQ